MIIIRKVCGNICRQSYGANQFKTVGVNALAIYTIGTPKFRLPLCFATPAIFVNIAQCQRRLQIILLLKRPFIKNRDTILQSNICKIIFVNISYLLIIKIINTHQRADGFVNFKFCSNVCIKFSYTCCRKIYPQFI